MNDLVAESSDGSPLAAHLVEDIKLLLVTLGLAVAPPSLFLINIYPCTPS